VTGPGETDEGSQRKEMGCWWRAHGIAGVALPPIKMIYLAQLRFSRGLVDKTVQHS
jgi:hypothetical protein